jgi:antitoxin MazE
VDCWRLGEPASQLGRAVKAESERKEENKVKGVGMSHDVTLAQWGNSLGIRIPKESCRRLDLKAGDHLDVDIAETAEGSGLFIRKKDEPFSLEGLFQGYQGDYKPELLDWGRPLGKEAWL